MKNQPFPRRMQFALAGIRTTFRTEVSFRTQAAFGAGAGVILIILRPQPIWWALLALAVGTVFTAELINTSLERLIDKLHPEKHPTIAAAKDCAAGAVLVASLVSLAVAAALLWERFVN